MRSSFLPLSSVPADLARDFLLRRGFPAEIIEWKYFDESFNRGRERALVWLNKDRVKGFIGIIPLRAGIAGQEKDMVWTCDWWVEEPEKSPGIGVMLLKKVHARYDHVGGVGGSDFTHAILPRMSSHMAADAAIFLHLPLKLGYLLEKAESKLPRLPKLSRTFIGNAPLRRSSGKEPPSVTVTEGVAKAIEPLFAAPTGEPWQPLYDHAHLDWLLGRCPGMTSFSCFLGDERSPDAGALFWSASRDPRYWRVALRARPGGFHQLDPVLSAVIRTVRAEKAAALSTIISHLDRGMLPFLRKRGFLRGPVQWPLYLFSSDRAGTPIPDLANLSYLDTDLATSF